jgi:WD40 repeat protein
MLQKIKNPNLLIERVFFSSDGTEIYTALDEGSTIYVVDFVTGTIKRTFTVPFDVMQGISFSADLAKIATGNRRWAEPVINVFDVASGKEIVNIEDVHYDHEFIRGQSAPYTFSPCGNYIASHNDKHNPDFYDDEKCYIFLWDIATGKQYKRFEAPRPFDVDDVIFSSDGKQLAAVFTPGFLGCFDITTGNHYLLALDSDSYKSSDLLAFNSKTNLISIIDSNGLFRKIDVRTGDIAERIKYETSELLFARVSPDEKYIVATDLEGALHVFDTENAIDCKTGIEIMQKKLSLALYDRSPVIY